MSAYAAERRPFGAAGRMGVVVGMHAALIFVLANAFGLVPGAKKPEPMKGVIVEDTAVIDEEPVDPIGPPSFSDPRFYIPAPDDPNYEADTEGAINVPLRPIDEIPTGRAVPEPDPAIGVRMDPRHPLTRPLYPAEAIKGEIEGAVVVEVLVQPDGRIGDARIVTSSGYDFFDRATLDEARRKWRMLPATRNGEPFAQWYRTRVVFKLTNK